MTNLPVWYKAVHCVYLLQEKASRRQIQLFRPCPTLQKCYQRPIEWPKVICPWLYRHSLSFHKKRRLTDYLSWSVWYATVLDACPYKRSLAGRAFILCSCCVSVSLGVLRASLVNVALWAFSQHAHAVPATPQASPPNTAPSTPGDTM